MTILFWDIDGTLLTTGKAGVPAWEAAVREVTGRDFQLSSIRIPGMTDYQIAVRTFELLGLPADDETLRRMVRRYEEGLPAALPLKQGRVLPNVREILEQLAVARRCPLLPADRQHARRCERQADALRSLASTSPTAPSPKTAASAPPSLPRALELARQAGPVHDERVFVIGDTPHDIHCADAIGARTIAVATGGYSLEELSTHHPWRVFAELPPPGEFIGLIEGRLEDAPPATGSRASLTAGR